MGDAVIVTVGDRFQHLFAEITGIGLIVRFLLAYPVEEIATGHELHDQEVALLFLEEVDQGTYVPVFERGQNGHLVVNGGIVAGGHIFAKDALDRDLLARGSVCTSADGGKRPRLELLLAFNVAR